MKAHNSSRGKATKNLDAKLIKVRPLNIRPINAKPIKAMILDADNTIFRTKEAAESADMAVMKLLSRRLGIQPSKLYSEWKSLVEPLKTSRDPKKRLRKYSYAQLLKKHKALSHNLIEEAYGSFQSEISRNLKIEPSFRKLLALADEFRIKMVLITEAPKDLTSLKLKRFGLEKRFLKVITSDDIGRMKPDMRYYQKALAALKKEGIMPKECIAVGDSFEKDLLIPKQLGTRTALFRGSDRRADYSISSYTPLGKLIETHKKSHSEN